MSEYNMKHTGKELDDAINKVRSGYIQPAGTLDITSNGPQNVKEYENVNVNVPTGTDIEWVTADIDLQTFQFSNVSHTFSEITEAVNAGKPVKIKVSYTSPFGGYETIYGDLSVYQENYVIFSMTALVNLGPGEGLYHFSITVSPADEIVVRALVINTTEMTI